jgi:hypothetical protein
MSGSSSEGKDLSIDWIKSMQPNNILDVGVGYGVYSRLIRDTELNVTIDGIEAWEPYIQAFDLNSIYDNLYNVDVRNWDNFNYDLVILGDVLEHMTKDEAIAIWDKVSKSAKYAIISIPIIHYPQNEPGGNPYQEHIKEDWSTEEVLETFSNIVEHKSYSVVGVFLAKFE